MSTKSCRSCCEKINAVAKKCPHCQAFQSRWVLWLIALPAAIPLLIILPLAVFPLWELSTETDVQFKEVKDQLKVTNARLKIDERPVEEGVTYYGQPDTWVYCTVKNNSDHRWESLEFLLEFANADGVRLDIDNASASVTSQPHSELEVRLHCKLAIDATEVSKTKVTVTDARQPYR